MLVLVHKFALKCLFPRRSGETIQKSAISPTANERTFHIKLDNAHLGLINLVTLVQFPFARGATTFSAIFCALKLLLLRF